MHEGLRESHLVLNPALVVTGSCSCVQECQLSMLGREEPPCWEAPAAVSQKELEVSGQLVSFSPTKSVSQDAFCGPKGKAIADSLLK